eukprot:89424_1
MNDGLFALSILVGALGMIGIWMIFRTFDNIHKRYLLSKYPVMTKGIVNAKYTNKHTKTMDNSGPAHVRYIKFSFCATDRNYATYTIAKTDHQIMNKYEWINLNEGDYIEVVYCAKEITLFELFSERKRKHNRWNSIIAPVLVLIASCPFLVSMFIPLFLGAGAGTVLAVMIAICGGLMMRLQKVCCCDAFWQRCKRNTTIMSVVSEVTTMGNSPELHVPSDSGDDSFEMGDQIQLDCTIIDTDENQIV